MRSIIIVAWTISCFLTLSLLFFGATRKTYPGFFRWTTGVGIISLGYMMLALRGFMPDAPSILIGNAAFPLAMVLHLDGLRRFLGLSDVDRRWYLIPGAVLAAVAVFYYQLDSPAWRSLVTAIGTSAPHFVMAALIFRQPVQHNSVFYSVIGSLLGFAGVLIVGRAIWAFFAPQFTLFIESPIQFVFFIGIIIAQIGETLAFIMLNSERVESELVEAEAVLRLTVQDLEQALAEVKTLRGLLPICSHCKKIRGDQGYWQAVEQFIQEHTDVQFSHSICPDCLKELYPDFAHRILDKEQ